jgi:transcriptional regulator with PAS, ATPase and Fis domain
LTPRDPAWQFETPVTTEQAPDDRVVTPMTTPSTRPLRGERSKSARAESPEPRAELYRDIIGAGPRMQRILKLVSKIATTDSTVLLLGESGTGKELVARSIHVQSRRAAGPFVPVNVGALPDTLVESELFGVVKGAFTGAPTDRPGLVELADQGTLFLDEIGDMPLTSQVKLLRTLENNEVRRLGSTETRLVDVRVIAATHRDLHAAVAQGAFREDLFYRLNVVQIELPALRERREDIGLLAAYFLDRIARRHARGPLAFTPEARTLLERYDYPGNVRELENAIEHAVAVSDGPEITERDLPTTIREPRLLPEPAATRRETGPGPAAEPGVDGDRDRWSLAEVEKEHIRRVLARHGGNATVAAKQLGISRTTLWRKLREYGLSRTGG